MTTRKNVKIDSIFRFFESVIRRILMLTNTFQARLRLGAAGKNIKIYYPVDFLYYHNIYIGNNVMILKNTRFVCSRAKIIIKDNVQIGKNVLMVAGNHNVTDIGKYMIDVNVKFPRHDRGITIYEDVFIIFNVIILDGVTIGRGAIVGTGSVVRKSIPPYSIVLGNPAKVIGFRFSPQLIIEHEKKLYKESDRISIHELEENYKKFYLNKFREIVSFMT
jgi:acetyltransferase-like isoleucine patch superfamily enzyme